MTNVAEQIEVAEQQAPAVEQESTVVISYEFIDPEMATEMLKNNGGNRKITPSNVRALAEQMKKPGGFKDTSDTIKLGFDNRLLDGQHRLSAIVLCGIGQWMTVARGLDDAIFDVLDTGLKRTTSDIVYMAGIKNSSKVAQIARMILTFNHGGYDIRSKKGKPFITNTDILKIAEDIDLQPYVEYGTKCFKKSRMIGAGEYGFFMWLLGKKDKKDATAFLDGLSSKTNLYEGSPILTLVRLLEDARSGVRYKFTQAERIALTIKAWNFFRLHQDNKPLNYNAEKQDFPEAL